MIHSHSMATPTATQRQHERLCDLLFLLGLAGTVAFVLWLPVFPTGDGPVHLYYADVLWSLVRHQPAYAHVYAIRHLLAPYLLHYLALVALEHFVSPPMAEKLFIAIIFVVTALGFRLLARALARQAGGTCVPVACIWVLPLLFSWSLGGGFLNCCFATGVALWSFGLWTHLAPAVQGRKAWLLAAYAWSLGLLVLSHPVPLLVLLLFTASDLLLQAVAPAADLAWRRRLPQAAAFLLTCAAFVAPVLVAQKGQAAAVLPGLGFHADVLRELLLGMRLGYFAGLSVHSVTGWLALVARAGLVLVVPGVVVLLCKGLSAPAAGSHVAALFLSEPPRRLLVITVLFLAATVYFPLSLNNSYFFPQRMWDICWLLVLACGAAARPSLRARQRLGWAGFILIALIAVTGLPALVRIARAQQQLAAAPLPPGGHGLFLEPDSAVEGWGAATTYPVFYWAGARAFAASRAILLNSPWLELTILPVRDAPSSGATMPAVLLDQGLPSIDSESPLALTHQLAAPSPDRATILARADFLPLQQPCGPGLTAAGGADPACCACPARLRWRSMALRGAGFLCGMPAHQVAAPSRQKERQDLSQPLTSVPPERVALSAVIPCYNEQESLAACHQRLAAVLTGLQTAAFRWEIVYVDDGSIDATSLLLAELHAAEPERVTVVTLARNFGHQPAVTAGLAAARGELVVILDADLQDPPEVLPQMLALCREGYDVVYGVRTSRDAESRFKLWTAKAFYRVLSRFSDVRIPLDAGDFRMVSRRVVDALLAMPERHRLLRAMCSWVGFRQTGVAYHREPRFAGATKYPFWRMVNLAFDGIFSFSTVPLRMLTYLGLLAACLAFIGVVWALFVRLFTHHWVQGWATLFIGMLFLSGLQMISLGIMGEYLGRVYTEVKQRPLYVVAKMAKGRE